MDRFTRRSALGISSLLMGAGALAAWSWRWRLQALLPPPVPTPHVDATFVRLDLPPRRAGAVTGSELVRAVAEIHPKAREQRIGEELLAGNVPDFERQLVPVELRIEGHTAVARVMPDYLAIGTDDDFVRVPMTPMTAQRVADAAGCVLPTSHLVDAVHAAARIKLPTAHIPLDPDGGTSQDFATHQRLIQEVLAKEHLRPGELVAGHKKDVVITPRMLAEPGRVAIYGMHQPDGTPLQMLSLVHILEYLDYSHGVRLVASSIQVDGRERAIRNVMRDPTLSALVSDEGPFELPRYAPASEGVVPHAVRALSPETLAPKPAESHGGGGGG